MDPEDTVMSSLRAAFLFSQYVGHFNALETRLLDQNDREVDVTIDIVPGIGW